MPSKFPRLKLIDKSFTYGTFLALIVGIAQLVERCLAKAKVAGSNPVSHSKLRLLPRLMLIKFPSYLLFLPPFGIMKQ